jgi:hypothetical protein
MRGIERAGVRATESQTIAERLMIEIEHIILAAMPAEVGYVVEAVGGHGVEEMVSPGPSCQRVGATLAF